MRGEESEDETEAAPLYKSTYTSFPDPLFGANGTQRWGLRAMSLSRNEDLLAPSVLIVDVTLQVLFYWMFVLPPVSSRFGIGANLKLI